MGNVRKKERKKKEISIKVKHCIFWILVIIAIFIFVSGIAFYKIGEKASFYESISKEINHNKISSCTDASCVIQKINTKPNVTEKDCMETPYREVCLNALYKKQALLSGDKDKCSSISQEGERNSCYMSLSLYYNNPSYCQYISDDNLKQLCLSAVKS